MSNPVFFSTSNPSLISITANTPQAMEIEETIPTVESSVVNVDSKSQNKSLVNLELLKEGPCTFAIRDFISANSSEENEISAHMHKHWLRDAINRIFADPLRSFLEIVNNALDAANPEHPIGKFGMGFLSILSFLNMEETKGAKIIITTTSFEAGQFITYSMTVFQESDEPKVTFRLLPSKEKTGTLIEIIPNEGCFDPTTINTVLKYIQTLQFYRYGKIKILTEMASHIIGNGEVKAEVYLDPLKLSVQDEGCGISLDISSTTLFVPSISTKKSTPSNGDVTYPEFVNYLGNVDSDFSHFLICIGGVVAIDIPLKQRFEKKDFLVYLPSDTPLPMARNALLPLPQTKQFFKKLINSLINDFEHKKIDSALIDALYLSLIALEDHNPATSQWGLVKFLQKKLFETFFAEDSSYVVFPSEYMANLWPIFSPWFNPNQIFTMSKALLERNWYLMEVKLLNFLKSFIASGIEVKAFNGEIIASKSLIFIKDEFLPKTPLSGVPIISSFGFNRLLFVPRSILENNLKLDPLLAQKQLSFDVSTRYFEEGKVCEPCHVLELSANQSFLKYESTRKFLISSSQSPLLNWDNSPFLEHPNHKGILEKYDDQPFEEFFGKYGFSIASTLDLLQSKKDYQQTILRIPFLPFDLMETWIGEELSDLNCFSSAEEKKEYFSNCLSRTYIFDLDEKKFFVFKKEKIIPYICCLEQISLEESEKCFQIDDPQAPSKSRIQGHIGHIPGLKVSPSSKEVKIENKILEEPEDFEEPKDFLTNQECLEEIPFEKVGKRFFEWLFHLYGISDLNSNVSLYTAEEKIWPLKSSLNFEDLLHLFNLMMNIPIERVGEELKLKKQSALKIPISESRVSQLHPNSWELLETIVSFNRQLFPKEQHSLFFNLFFPTYELRDLFLHRSKLNQEIIKEGRRFFDKIHGTLIKYLTIANSELVHSYGNPPDFSPLFEKAEKTLFDLASHTHFVCTAEQVASFLDCLANNSSKATVKLFNLVENALEDQFSLLERNKALLDETPLPVFPVTSYNALALLAKLFVHEVHISYLISLIDASITHQDLYLSCILILDVNAQNRFKSEDADLLKVLEIVQIGVQDLLSSSLFHPKITFFKDVIEKVNDLVKSVPYDALRIYLEKKSCAENSKVTPFIEHGIVAQLENAKHFSTYQLIAAVSNKEFKIKIEEKNLTGLIEVIRSAQAHSEKLNVIAHTVGASTEKGTHESFVSECLSNSADAIRGYILKKNLTAEQIDARSKITFSVQLCGDKEKPQLVTRIHDQIGMTYKTLMVDYLIPSYSTKTKEEGAIGEMGNGSFQNKREEIETVKTRDPETGKVYFLKTTSIRNSEGKVVDLHNKCIEITEQCDPHFTGTEVSILYLQKQMSVEQQELNALLVTNYIRKKVASSYMPLPHDRQVRCYLQLSNGTVEELNAYDREGLILNFSDVLPGSFAYLSLPLKDPNEMGSILTAGTNFQKIPEFLKEMEIDSALPEELARGYNIFLPLNSYTPTQSRTKIYMNKTQKAQFIQFLTECFYSQLYLRTESELANRFLPHFQSNCFVFSQILPEVECTLSQEDLANSLFHGSNEGKTQVLERFLVNYKPFFSPNKSFYEYIKDFIFNYSPYLSSIRNYFIKLLYDGVRTKKEINYPEVVNAFKKLIDPHLNKYIATIPIGDNKYLKSFLENAILGWIKPKLEVLKQSLPTLSLIKESLPPEISIFAKNEKELEKDAAIEKASLEVLGLKTFSEAVDWMKGQLSCARQVVNSYCQLFIQKHAFVNPVDCQLYFQLLSQENAKYLLDKKTIFFNVGRLSVSSFLEIVITMNKKGNIHYLPGSQLFLTSLIHSGTVNHELLHAKRGEDCSQSKGNVHGFGTGLRGKYSNFEVLAAEYADILFQEGFFNEWVALLEPLIKMNNLEDSLQKLGILESKYPAFISKLMAQIFHVGTINPPETKKKKTESEASFDLTNILPFVEEASMAFVEED